MNINITIIFLSIIKKYDKIFCSLNSLNIEKIKDKIFFNNNNNNNKFILIFELKKIK